jgi:hypothetical protein
VIGLTNAPVGVIMLGKPWMKGLFLCFWREKG